MRVRLGAWVVAGPEAADPDSIADGLACPRGSPEAHPDGLGRLTVGNTAKLYCLKLIDRVAAGGRSLMLVDLGCGDGRHVVGLLGRRPNVRYVGVDLSSRACERARVTLAGRGEVICSPAYDIKLGPAQVVISFSVFEHVYQRPRYLQCLRANLAADGVALMNYDAGHFIASATLLGRLQQRWKGPARRLLASLGLEQFYQARVREAEFKRQVAAAGLRVVDEKFFNTDLKTVYRLVSDRDRDEFMERWLELELYLNRAGVRYHDGLAGVFRTRNFVLARAEAETTVLGEF